jgi:hypothetical protein
LQPRCASPFSLTEREQRGERDRVGEPSGVGAEGEICRQAQGRGAYVISANSYYYVIRRS